MVRYGFNLDRRNGWDFLLVGGGSHRTGKKGGCFVATGFQKWGMTSSMVAAMLLTDLVTERENPLAEVYDPSRSMLKPQLFCNAGQAIVNLLTPTGKRCPHLGCALKWNEVEHTWDCPCHGSRFSENGGVM